MRSEEESLECLICNDDVYELLSADLSIVNCGEEKTEGEIGWGWNFDLAGEDIWGAN